MQSRVNFREESTVDGEATGLSAIFPEVLGYASQDVAVPVGNRDSQLRVQRGH